MEFLIADSFTDSLTRLTNDEQKAVKTTAFDLQMNPTGTGLNLHRLDRSKDKRFWSVRVSEDLRLIIHRDASSLLLCYTDHHEAAYTWANRRKLETHPRTRAAMFVEVRERVEEVVVPAAARFEEPEPRHEQVGAALANADGPRVFDSKSDEELLIYGVPVEWLGAVRDATEDDLLELAGHLPAEAAEALLELAVGGTPFVSQPAEPQVDPLLHPDAQRRFRVVANVQELERALSAPWEKWAVFLHPAQREAVERDYTGPARIAGSAGTGKTVVALHRAAYLAKHNPDARILLTTFSEPLARALAVKLRYLVDNTPRVRKLIEVRALDAVADRQYEKVHGRAELASREVIINLLATVASEVKTQRFALDFLVTEWEEILDPWQLTTWEAYRDVQRLGRKVRLPESQRAELWQIFQQVISRLAERNIVTQAQILGRLTDHIRSLGESPFDFVVVDEAQDVSVPQLRLLAALSGGRPNSLFLTGDLGQRIFQQPFSWKSLGVDIRGRSRILRVNYRTSHQIRTRADRLLPQEVADVDGNVEDRRGTISVLNGPAPVIQTLDSEAKERSEISSWLKDRVAEKVKLHEIGVFVRSEAQIPRARKGVEQAGLRYKVLDERIDVESGHVSVGTMHLAKGLEFKAVVVAACDYNVIPLQERVAAIVDESDLEEVYNTERHLLYVACTRARDNLLVTAVRPPSEFLDDLEGR
jgi:UvrD/REP helicase N-terminal domain/UvrD-like helicase C-terminal domain